MQVGNVSNNVQDPGLSLNWYQFKMVLLWDGAGWTQTEQNELGIALHCQMVTVEQQPLKTFFHVRNNSDTGIQAMTVCELDFRPQFSGMLLSVKLARFF